jgi:GAF domain-containing protein
VQNRFDRQSPVPGVPFEQGLQTLIHRLSRSLERDDLVQRTTNELREQLRVNRIALYYFYREWKGRVAFESLSDRKYSIYGETGPDECFNGEYAKLYLEGRVRSIPDIEVEPIAECHRDFLRGMQVRANLVVPILITPQNESNPQVRLWGLLVAHHCQSPKDWQESDVQAMRRGAETLAMSPVIVNISEY